MDIFVNFFVSSAKCETLRQRPPVEIAAGVSCQPSAAGRGPVIVQISTATWVDPCSRVIDAVIFEFAVKSSQKFLTDLTANFKLLRSVSFKFQQDPPAAGRARLVEGLQNVQTPRDWAHAASVGPRVHDHRSKRSRIDRRRRAAVRSSGCTNRIHTSGAAGVLRLVVGAPAAIPVDNDTLVVYRRRRRRRPVRGQHHPQLVHP
jgi:hypothetical protein